MNSQELITSKRTISPPGALLSRESRLTEIANVIKAIHDADLVRVLEKARII